MRSRITSTFLLLKNLCHYSLPAKSHTAHMCYSKCIISKCCRSNLDTPEHNAVKFAVFHLYKIPLQVFTYTMVPVSKSNYHCWGVIQIDTHPKISIFSAWDLVSKRCKTSSLSYLLCCRVQLLRTTNGLQNTSINSSFGI